MTDKTEKFYEKHVIEACDSIRKMAEEGGFRESKEAFKALTSLEWFGNFGEPVQRQIEEAQEDIAELEGYESAEEFGRAEGIY